MLEKGQEGENWTIQKAMGSGGMHLQELRELADVIVRTLTIFFGQSWHLGWGGGGCTGAEQRPAAARGAGMQALGHARLSGAELGQR